MSDRISSLEELVELIPELAGANDFACYPVGPEPPATRVVHVNDAVEGAVYIGRRNNRRGLAASPFENPLPIGHDPEHLQRKAVIDRYRKRILSSPELLRLLPELRGKPLACWCRHDGEAKTPANACHGDVLVELLERYTDDELRAMAR